MPLITPENIDSTISSLYYYDYSAVTKGRAYFAEKRVTIQSFDGETAECLVRGHQEDYPVVIFALAKQTLDLDCTCPQADKSRYCKHMVAGLLAVREYILSVVRNQWQYKLKSALEDAPKPKAPPAPRRKNVVVFGLLHETHTYSAYPYRLVPFVIKPSGWNGASDLEGMSSRQEQNAFLDHNRTWIYNAQYVTTALDHQTVVNLPLEGVYFVNMAIKMGAYYYGLTDFAVYLPLLARLDAPVFRLASNNAFKERLQLLETPVRVEASLTRDKASYALHAGLVLNGETFTTIKSGLEILNYNPAWALAGQHIVPIENPEALSLLSFFPMTIPDRDEQEFRDHYLRPIAERMPIHGNVISWSDVDVSPAPRLYLQDDEGRLRAALSFGYGAHEVGFSAKPEAIALVDVPGSWSMVRVHRHMEDEERFFRMLTDARYGLKRATSGSPPGTFELRARTHPLDFLIRSIPLLTEAGFEIFGEEKLKMGRINRSEPRISLSISSGLDWFDLKAVVQYGDQHVDLRDIRRALRKHEQYIKLADGSIGRIPDEWLKKYKKLFDLAEESAGGLRVRDVHLPLVDTLLADAEESHVAAEFQQRRDLLQGFDKIQPQPVPQGFSGALPAYQKAGLDWLHFLHDYGFGGCLADDMGLGKTIQVLAFLQSRKEQGKAGGPTLLVVPKSIIANWLREAERFTPGLTFLEYTGALRKKDASVLAEYDVVLTTYGILLRDVDFLRSVHFDYAILDESQAIKNPLAQVSKAARLLDARHRLVMTGTPVENTTFDLWSQFAFLNPGLLGSLEYFKREFAGSIESREDRETAQLLRRLVYPFILRRTKEQVAPELPPRSEHILYTDFEAAQRKVYNRTRDYYRGMLMGMIESEGIDDARMKILEGLLRLRQIAIHPALVDAAYRGESAKFELLLETLDNLRAEGHKALVFSQFVQTLNLLRSKLDADHVRYAYLDGQTADRQGQVDLFQDDPSIPLFLISLKAGGVGLNLTAADYVIHIDPWWNPAVEMQAADRAHRIGQDKPVFVYKIIARDSVEEKILQLQERKRELVEQLISPEGSFFKNMTKEDVKVLFS